MTTMRAVPQKTQSENIYFFESSQYACEIQASFPRHFLAHKYFFVTHISHSWQQIRSPYTTFTMAIIRRILERGSGSSADSPRELTNNAQPNTRSYAPSDDYSSPSRQNNQYGSSSYGYNASPETNNNTTFDKADTLPPPYEQRDPAQNQNQWRAQPQPDFYDSAQSQTQPRGQAQSNSYYQDESQPQLRAQPQQFMQPQSQSYFQTATMPGQYAPSQGYQAGYTNIPRESDTGSRRHRRRGGRRGMRNSPGPLRILVNELGNLRR
jgi:hypothetical protein